MSVILIRKRLFPALDDPPPCNYTSSGAHYLQYHNITDSAKSHFQHVAVTYF